MNVIIDSDDGEDGDDGDVKNVQAIDEEEKKELKVISGEKSAGENIRPGINVDDCGCDKGIET